MNSLEVFTDRNGDGKRQKDRTVDYKGPSNTVSRFFVFSR